MLDLEGKWALVTGASRGIGREIATALANTGCHLVLHARTAEHTDSLANELRKNGTQVEQLCGDLGDSEQIVTMLESLADLPDIDILFNNAAVMHPFVEDAWNISAESFRQTFEINVLSQVRLCDAIVPGMIERGFGRVVNLVSDINKVPNLAPYAVSKAALEKYTHDIVPLLENTGVAMNALNPSWIRTDMGSDEAPNPVDSVVPGALVPAVLPAEICGARFEAQDYRGMSLEAAVEKALANLAAAASSS